MSKEIQLAHGQAAIVDDADYALVSTYRWFLKKSENTFYAESGKSKKNPAKRIFMHVLIMGTPKGLETDHINGNGLDNRRCNLRICTHAENVRNRGKSDKNTSGFKGVFPQENFWRAQITFSGKKVVLGSFKNPEDAARAYDAAAIRYHGEFANTNFPDTTTRGRDHERTNEG